MHVRPPISAVFRARRHVRCAAAVRPVAMAVLALLAGMAAAQTGEPLHEPLELRATPMLAEKLPREAKPPSLVYGERITGRPGLEMVIEGDAELRRPGLTARSDKITHDQGTGIASFDGHIRVNAKGDRYTATEGRLQADAFEGFFLQPTYRFLANGAYGNASRIEFHDPDRATILNGNYTTCRREEGDDWQPGWILRADRIDIDREEDEGRAKGAVLQFKGVPILPLPSLSFPLSEQRKSGWLPPTIGLDNKSGMDLAVPYYWNIAPQRDATFTPEVMLRRGFNAMGEFRYMESNYKGRINASYMPNDRLRGRDRWSLFVRHNGAYDTGLASIGTVGVNLNLNRVSDNNYWSDFTHGAMTTRLLTSDAALNWAHGDFSFSARTQKWQTLQDVTAPIVPPYDRMPQLSGRWARVNDRGFDYSVDADYTRFRGDPALMLQPNADRALLRAQLARPFTRPWGFVTPKAQLHATNYRFDRALANGATSASRIVPTLSVDGGLVFERDASYFGRAFRQTLEPRLMYVYTPYRNQQDLPNYDSGLYDFNFATIWADNFFAGDDRVVDNNLITGGLTTRLLDPENGAEAVRLAIAQRYRFSGQKVVLPGGTPTSPGWSDIMLGASINWDPRWAFDTVVQYNPDTRRSTRTTIDARWSPGPYRTISAAYRVQRDLNSRSIDVGWQWPLSGLFGGGKAPGAKRARAGGGGSCGSGAWYSTARINYSLSDRKVADGVVGVEYDAGCWIGRVVVEQLNSTTTSATRRIMFQLEFVGLSRVGSNLMSTLRNNIPRYQNLREEAPPPSRFTAYD
ncbi:MAG: LPS-assembly protein LptD [Desulfovibrionaceae bacterium]|nr:LPS-assembly protein LptD [Desulfovibrionaceae bacterium]